LGASSPPLATVQADHGATRRFCGRPRDRGSASPPVTCPDEVLRLVRAARAITVKPALVSIGRRNSRLSGRPAQRLECLRGGRHRARPVEPNHEQAWMVEQINRRSLLQPWVRSSVASVSGPSRFALLVGAPQPSRPAGVAFPLLRAPARRRLERALLGRGSAAPVSSATRVPACTWRMPSALPCRAVSGLGSNGWRRLPSRVLLLPPRREEAERLTLHPRCLCVRTANACRTGHAFVTLPPLVSPPARKREDAGASPGSLSYPQSSCRIAKAGWSAAERDRVYGG
jgi:hypothetical protein